MSISYYKYLSFALILSMSLNVRYTLSMGGQHIGGADFIVAPYMLLIPFVLILCLIGSIHTRKRFTTERILIVSLLIILPLLTGTVNATAIEYSILEIIRQIFVLAMFYIFLVAASDGRYEWLYYAIFAVIGLQASFVALQILGINPIRIGNENAHFLNEGVSRYTGLSGHPNILAGLVNLIYPFILVAALNPHDPRRKICACFCVFCAFLIFATFSRAGIITFLATSLYCLVRSRIDGTSVDYRKIIITFMLVIAVTILAFIYFDDMYYRFVESRDAQVTSRITMNETAIRALLANPIFGAGTNNFIHFSYLYDETRLSEFWFAPVHNYYLLLASEMGIIGIVCFIVLYAKVINKLLIQGRMNNGRKTMISFAVEAAFIGLMISSLVGYFYRQEVAQPGIALLLSLAFVANGSSLHSRHVNQKRTVRPKRKRLR